MQPAVLVREVSSLVDCMTLWTPISCISRIFLYLWPKVRSVAWPFHYKSMEKNENVCRFVCKHKKSPNISESQLFGPPVTSKGVFFADSLLKGHPRSFEATNILLPITFDWKDIERWDGFIVFGSLRRIDWYATWPILITTWPWPEVKVWAWPFGVKNTFFEASEWEKHDSAIANSLSLLIQKLFAKERKNIPEHLFSQCLTYGGLAVDLTSILMMT